MSCFHKSRTWNDVRWATPFLRLQFVRGHFGQMSPARPCDCGAEDGRCSRPYASKREKRTSQGFSCTCHAMMAARYRRASCPTSHHHGIASPNDVHAANAVRFRCSDISCGYTLTGYAAPPLRQIEFQPALRLCRRNRRPIRGLQRSNGARKPPTSSLAKNAMRNRGRGPIRVRTLRFSHCASSISICCSLAAMYLHCTRRCFESSFAEQCSAGHSYASSSLRWAYSAGLRRSAHRIRLALEGSGGRTVSSSGASRVIGTAWLML